MAIASTSASLCRRFNPRDFSSNCQLQLYKPILFMRQREKS
jgi:hypothetical protein